VAAVSILPSFVMVLLLSAAYVHFGGIWWMQGLFYGIGAAVIAIIGRSAYKLVRMTLGRDWLMWAICAVSTSATVWTQSEVVWFFLLSGAVALFVKARPRAAAVGTALGIAPLWLIAGLHGPAPGGTLWQILWYFAEAGAFVFGSGLAIVPFLYGGVVQHFHWLTERQFVDAVAVAMITPGPVVITAAFIGYLPAGPIGATLAAIGVFLPCYLFVIIPAKYFRRSVNNPNVRASVDGVTAAAAGAIVGAAIVLGRRAIVDVPTALVGPASGAVQRFSRRAKPVRRVSTGRADKFQEVTTDYTDRTELRGLAIDPLHPF